MHSLMPHLSKNQTLGLESSLIQAHLENSQSTHNKAAMASAGRLINALRVSYVGIKSDEGINHIMAYLSHPTNGEPYDPALITQIYQYFQGLIQASADHWTQNSMYDTQEQHITMVDATLAEVLNLVCFALLDNTSYPEDVRTPKDTRLRVDSLISCLNYFRQHPGICSGGIQHDILFLLNGCWQNFHVIEDIGAFILDSLKEEIIKLNPPLDILRYWAQCTILPSRNLSVEVRTRAEAEIKNAEEKLVLWSEQKRSYLFTALLSRCEEYSLNPNAPDLIKTIETFLANLNNLNVPSIPGVECMIEIMKAMPFSNPNPIVNVRNTALEIAKASLLHCQSIEEINQSQALKDFVRIEPLLKALLHYHQLTHCILSESTGQLRDAMILLNQDLLVFWQNFPNRQLTETFEEHRRDFEIAIRRFDNDNHIDWITNIFTLLQSNLSNLQPWFGHVRQFHDVHSLAFSDPQILAWQEQSIVFSPLIVHQEEAIAQPLHVEITPFEINRFLLHAFVIPPEEWTVLFRTRLQEVIIWLQNPESDQLTLAFTALRQNYPGDWLDKLRLILLISGSPHLDIAAKQMCFRIIKKDMFYFSAASSIEKLVTELPQQRAPIWDTLKDNLRPLIRNGFDLRHLLECSYFTADQKRQIWQAVEHDFPQLIEHTNQLSDLMACSNLSKDDRTQIWMSVYDHLPNLILNGFLLRNLFECSELTPDQWQHVWDSVRTNFPRFIKKARELRYLLELDSYPRYSRLKDDHRKQIWEAMKDNLPALIQNEVKELSDLLSCPTLVEEQRTHILISLRHELSGLIDNNYQKLSELIFCLYLSPSHRTLILEVIQNDLPRILQNAMELGALLSCSIFTSYQKRQIWDAIHADLPRLIQNAGEFRYLLSVCCTDVERLTLTLAAAQPNLPRLIQNATELNDLLKCSWLTPEQRTQILNGVEENLAHLIQDASQLRSLLYCKFLTTEQVTRIANCVVPQTNFKNFIKNLYELYNLLNCSFLTDEHRTIILDAIEKDLPRLGKTNQEMLQTLINCPRLTEDHRIKIQRSIPADNPSPNRFFNPPTNQAGSLMSQPNTPEQQPKP